MIAPVKIAGIAKSMPEKVVDNFDLEKIVDTSDEWITKRTGINTRYIATNEKAIDLGTNAVKEAIANAGIDKNDIGLIIASTFTSEIKTPSMASYIKKQLDVDDCASMDISAGCTGFVYSLITAASLMDTLNIDTAVVVASETLSTYVDWTDRATCVLFGDGAGAVVLTRSEKPHMNHAIMSGTPDTEDVIILRENTRKTPFNDVQEESKDHLFMAGREVFTFAVGAVEKTLNKLYDMCGDKPFTKIIPHQANEKIIDYVIRKGKFDKEQFFVNIGKYANTSSATIPIAMCDAYSKGWLQKGDRIALVGFGSGLTFGGVVIDWAI